MKQKQKIKTNLPITRNVEEEETIKPESSDKTMMRCYFDDCRKVWLSGQITQKITCAGCCRKLERDKAIVKDDE